MNIYNLKITKQGVLTVPLSVVAIVGPFGNIEKVEIQIKQAEEAAWLARIEMKVPQSWIPYYKRPGLITPYKANDRVFVGSEQENLGTSAFQLVINSTGTSATEFWINNRPSST